MLHKGEDSFSTDPDTVNEIKCRVCGEICDVKRGVIGATSWIEAMCQKSHLHDSFTCPHYKEDWHRQIRSLRKEKRVTSSSAIKKILEEEITLILSTRQTTGDWKPGYND